MKKICFLLGAGADSSLKIASGSQFAIAVLGLEKDYEKTDSIVRKYYSKKLKEIKNNWYPSIIEDRWKPEHLLKAAIRRKHMYDKYKSQTDLRNLIKSELDKYNDKLYALVTYYDDYCSYMGLIDGAFHTIINPVALGSKRFWRAIIAFTNAYLYICDQCKIINENDFTYEDALNKPKDAIIRIKEKCKDISEENYYSILKEYNDNISIVTTNYTPFAKDLVGLCDNEVAHIHGNIQMFENPRTLEVVDICEDGVIESMSKEDIYFPFLSLQSGVKPIVCSYQIKEYAKMIELLENCDEIAVLGYQFNPDDNHLNSIIREALQA